MCQVRVNLVMSETLNNVDPDEMVNVSLGPTLLTLPLLAITSADNLQTTLKVNIFSVVFDLV